jgi:hypothetical protein
LEALTSEQQLQGTLIKEIPAFMGLSEARIEEITSKLNKDIVPLTDFSQEMGIEEKVFSTLLSLWVDTGLVQGEFIGENSVFLGVNAATESPILSRYLETLDEGGAVSVEAITTKFRLPEPQVLDLFEELASQRDRVMTIFSNRIIFVENVVHCQMCDTKFNNPTKYYQCTGCKRKICVDCTYFLPGEEPKSCPLCNSPMTVMIKHCVKCNVNYYDLERMMGETDRCPRCGYALETLSIDSSSASEESN